MVDLRLMLPPLPISALCSVVLWLVDAVLPPTKEDRLHAALGTMIFSTFALFMFCTTITTPRSLAEGSGRVYVSVLPLDDRFLLMKTSRVSVTL